MTTTWYRIGWKEEIEELVVVKESPKSIVIRETDWNNRTYEVRQMLDHRTHFRTLLEALKAKATTAARRYESAKEALTAASREMERADLALANYEPGIK